MISKFLRRPDFSSIARCCRTSIDFERFIILADLWPIYPRSTGPFPYFDASIRSDQTEVLWAAFCKLSMLFFSFTFWASSNSCWRWKLVNQVEKFPLCTSMFDRLIDRIWSTQPSKKQRSWETKINPFFRFRYAETVSLAFISKWFVGSSISKKCPSFRKRAASSTLVCSPLESVKNGLQSTSSRTSR